MSEPWSGGPPSQDGHEPAITAPAPALWLVGLLVAAYLLQTLAAPPALAEPPPPPPPQQVDAAAPPLLP